MSLFALMCKIRTENCKIKHLPCLLMRVTRYRNTFEERVIQYSAIGDGMLLEYCNGLHTTVSVSTFLSVRDWLGLRRCANSTMTLLPSQHSSVLWRIGSLTFNKKLIPMEQQSFNSLRLLQQQLSWWNRFVSASTCEARVWSRVHSFFLAMVRRGVETSSCQDPGCRDPEGEGVEVSVQVVDIATFVAVGVSQRNR